LELPDLTGEFESSVEATAWSSSIFAKRLFQR